MNIKKERKGVITRKEECHANKVRKLARDKGKASAKPTNVP